MSTSEESGKILVTGATGKVGQAFIARLLADPEYDRFTVRALCHNRKLEPESRLEVVTGSLQHREVADRAVAGATHVLHLATTKETPETIMDVAIKGMFWLLEACRTRQASTDMGTLKGSPNPPAELRSAIWVDHDGFGGFLT